MKQITLSEQIIQEIRQKGKKRLIWSIVKTLLVYGIGLTALFLTGGQSDLFNPTDSPIWFWSVFAIILIFPIWKFQIYKAFRFAFRGEVVELENTTRLGGKKGEIEGYIRKGDISEMGRIDVCVVTIKTANGSTRKYEFLREDAQFARAYYQQGDSVFVPAFAEYPFNESREVEKSFCLYCGRMGDEHETNCPNCGVPFVKKEEKENA